MHVGSSEEAYGYTTFPLRFVGYKWFKPLLVGMLTAGFTTVFTVALTALCALWLGDVNRAAASVETTSPSFFAGPGLLLGIGSVATLLPSLALAALIVRDRPFSSYSSSRGGWNWSAFLKCLAVGIVIYGALTAVQVTMFPDASADGVNRFTVAGIVLCTLLVPFQAAAEEYVFRGLIMQAVGSWTKLPAVAIAVSTLVFAVSHSYDVFGITAIVISGLAFSIATWYTRGLEASTALHIVNNLSTLYLVGLGLAVEGGGAEAVAIVLLLDVAYCATVMLLGNRFSWFAPKARTNRK